MTTQTITHTQGLIIKTQVKISHKQKSSTSKRKVLVETKKDKVFNDICFLMAKNERAKNQRELRRAKR